MLPPSMKGPGRRRCELSPPSTYAKPTPSAPLPTPRPIATNRPARTPLWGPLPFHLRDLSRTTVLTATTGVEPSGVNVPRTISRTRPAPLHSSLPALVTATRIIPLAGPENLSLPDATSTASPRASPARPCTDPRASHSSLAVPASSALKGTVKLLLLNGIRNAPSPKDPSCAASDTRIWPRVGAEGAAGGVPRAPGPGGGGQWVAVATAALRGSCSRARHNSLEGAHHRHIEKPIAVEVPHHQRREVGVVGRPAGDGSGSGSQLAAPDPALHLHSRVPSPDGPLARTPRGLPRAARAPQARDRRRPHPCRARRQPTG